jgi:hypothetical protein
MAQKHKYSVALFANKRMNTYDDVMRIVGKYSHIYDLSCRPHEYRPYEHEEILSKVNLVVSVFNPLRISGTALSIPNFNIHAAPTWYRGIGAIGRAIADKMERHGIVVHEMVYEYDAGAIFVEETFDIRGLSAIDIGAQCVERTLKQLDNFCMYFSINGVLPLKATCAKWSGIVMQLREFREWLEKAEFAGKEDVVKIYSPF